MQLLQRVRQMIIIAFKEKKFLGTFELKAIKRKLRE